MEIEKEIEFAVCFKAKFTKHEDGGVSVHIPETDTFFSAPNEDEAKRRCGIMVRSFIQFWKEENDKGVLKQ